MNILLVKPISGTSFHQVLGPDIGLGYLATALMKKGCAVDILDCPKENFSFSDWEKFWQKNKTFYQLVGFKTYSKDLLTVQKSIKILKDINPKIITIVGGPHPSGEPEQIFNQIPLLDFAFYGESEIGISKLIENPYLRAYLSDISSSQHLSRKQERFAQKEFGDEIPNLIYPQNGEVKINKQEFVKDLDSLGFPAWEILKPHSYQKFSRVMGPYIPLFTTRGCPYSCTYCSAWRINGRNIRYRSISHIIEEIKYLKENFKISHFAIADDNFTFNKKFVISLCEEILRQNIKIRWDCASNGVRLDTMDKELLKIMERAGCTALTIAVESGEDRILKDMRKGFKINKAFAVAELIKKTTKMELEGFFMLGYPEETKEDIKKTIKTSKMMNLDLAEFFLFTPHPGTEIYNRLKKEGRLNNIDWSSFNYNKISYVPEGMKPYQLKLLQIYAYLTFYLRPKIVLKFLLRRLNKQQLKTALTRLFFLLRGG